MGRRRPNGRFLRRFRKSKRGIDTILAELLMVTIVVVMAAIVFLFYSGVFGALLGTVRLHPENFQIVASGAPSSGFNVSAVHPTPGGPPHFSTSGTSCTGTITPVNVNYYVPPGASCTINGGTFQSININYGASLTLNGGNLQAVNDNYSASITITNNAHVAGGMSLYGTQSFSMTGSNAASGAVTMDGVVYATYSSNNLGATMTVKNSGSVQFDSNMMSGATTFTNDQIVRFTNNTVNGTLFFTSDPNCYQANNTVSGANNLGACTGGAPSGGLDIVNTGSYTVSFGTVYLDTQPWNGVSWQLAIGATEQCGGTVIPVGPCTQMPIVIPPNTMVHVTFSWVNPTPNSVVNILMWTTVGNYLEARIDPTAGLVCTTRSEYGPRVSTGFC